MHQLYAEILQYIVAAGQRLVERAGSIADIGIAKSDLTEEDLLIERELHNLIKNHSPSHEVFAEEEHAGAISAADVWVIDPISGTRAFIGGLSHYAIVVTHLHQARPVFAAVYDPSVRELFVARAGQGAFLNERRIGVSNAASKVVFNLAPPNVDAPETAKIWQAITGLDAYRNTASFALNYCWVASGRFDGVVSYTKDTFPEFAGSLMLAEAGGRFTDFAGNPGIDPQNRAFVGGNPQMHDKLLANVANIYPPKGVRV